MNRSRDYQSKRVSAEEAIQKIKSGDRVIIPICCGLPQTLMEALILRKDLSNVEIVGGLQLDYPFLEERLEKSFSYRTWQCTPRIRHHMKKGTVKYMPIRQGDVPSLFSKKGIWPIDVALIQVNPMDSQGFFSLGVSISHSLPTGLEASTVIAEVNEQMPRVGGQSLIHLSNIDWIVESSRPLLEYSQSAIIGPMETAIGSFVSELIEDGSTLQVGIGSIPESILQHLKNKKFLKFFGMGVDGIVDLIHSEAITTSEKPSIIVTEVLGTKKIFNFIDRNPLVEGRPTPEVINSRVIAQIPKFVSILGTLEIDLTGQINSETVEGEQYSAIGGSFDFLQGALFSPGGKSIVALTSTIQDKRISRIKDQLPIGSAVTIPRHCVQFVVTEQGIADLRGKSLSERAKALISIAHPDFRGVLEESFSKRFGRF
jgi:4-hydroxybutyrate CoA-transferase